MRRQALKRTSWWRRCRGSFQLSLCARFLTANASNIGEITFLSGAPLCVSVEVSRSGGTIIRSITLCRETYQPITAGSWTDCHTSQGVQLQLSFYIAAHSARRSQIATTLCNSSRREFSSVCASIGYEYHCAHTQIPRKIYQI